MLVISSRARDIFLLLLFFAMASPNAAIALRLRQSRTFEVVPPPYRDAWLAACLEVPEGHLDPPGDGIVWEDPIGDRLSLKVKNRLNDYGLAAGYEFIIVKHRLMSLKVACKHYGFTKLNTHKLKDDVVRKDPVTREIVSDRKRNKDDYR